MPTGGALVNIDALLRSGVPSEALATHADILSDETVRYADLVVRARVAVVTADADVGPRASAAEGVARDSVRALAGVAARCVDAQRTFRADRRNPPAFVVVNASADLVCRADESRCAKAFRLLVNDHAMRVRATGDRLAGMAALVADIRRGTQAALLAVADGISRAVGV